jgi:hypothetical protein
MISFFTPNLAANGLIGDGLSETTCTVDSTVSRPCRSPRNKVFLCQSSPASCRSWCSQPPWTALQRRPAEARPRRRAPRTPRCPHLSPRRLCLPQTRPPPADEPQQEKAKSFVLSLMTERIRKGARWATAGSLNITCQTLYNGGQSENYLHLHCKY